MRIIVNDSRQVNEILGYSPIKNVSRLPLIADLYRRGIASPLMEFVEVCYNGQFQ